MRGRSRVDGPTLCPKEVKGGQAPPPGQGVLPSSGHTRLLVCCTLWRPCGTQDPFCPHLPLTGGSGGAVDKHIEKLLGEGEVRAVGRCICWALFTAQHSDATFLLAGLPAAVLTVLSQAGTPSQAHQLQLCVLVHHQCILDCIIHQGSIQGHSGARAPAPWGTHTVLHLILFLLILLLRAGSRAGTARVRGAARGCPQWRDGVAGGVAKE